MAMKCLQNDSKFHYSAAYRFTVLFCTQVHTQLRNFPSAKCIHKHRQFYTHENIAQSTFISLAQAMK